ncbi:response regulator receiver and ANTAR domain protein [Rhodoblastus acidophilus]|uniref:Response regulator receiver and ANTAR domain protein n=1 Tax=Rhodoblastus acidophilus TaxID=1074 RepID=A0A212Q6Z9_RHOAC|nr:ANTAR domain-containing protein [Rhodoblastus acidophilus]PPQ36325.1 two-component system response regulator [Rhodoblastus acidophilus]RAI19712.1 two-component system response regulator [Rhodoblastus acidophilus]SNB55148.1 response regulator receiver and ANTAR domain protein [Rhodoblastus acidophilus]
MPDKELRIVIADPNPLRASILRDGLREAGHVHVTVIDTFLDLETRLCALNPDMVLIDLENPSRDVLEQMIRISGADARPVAMFADASDAAMINAAIDAGVSAYVVDGLKKERVRTIVDVSVSRFNAFARLREELQAAKDQLADRKAIDQAKALVIKAKKISEEQAYSMMRKVAMNEGKKIADVARAILTAAELLR